MTDVLSKVKSKKYSFVDVLKVTHGKSRIRIRIGGWIGGSGSAPTCKGSGTLVQIIINSNYRQREKKYNSKDELGQQEYF
jgi:hypothetical protein